MKENSKMVAKMVAGAELMLLKPNSWLARVVVVMPRCVC